MIIPRPKEYLPTPETALAGRAERPFSVPERHAVLDTPLEGPVPEGLDVAVFGLGCFWGEEKMFWETSGVWTTAVGYAGGVTPHPTYEEVCSGKTGHAEVIRVVFNPQEVGYDQLLRTFWEAHDPTQGMRQGNDAGSNYRSIILTTSPEQQAAAEQSRSAYQQQMTEAGYGEITTEIRSLDTFYYAEDYHQQYLHKNPYGYCPIHATGVTYAV